ncbi:MAG TPA: hypothetical protein VFX86_01825 [Candidatus Saccharimonadales bacterium]|nr:hypothetical protein [Candidatus Saccharimonadales bacterium]
MIEKLKEKFKLYDKKEKEPTTLATLLALVGTIGALGGIVLASKTDTPDKFDIVGQVARIDPKAGSLNLIPNRIRIPSDDFMASDLIARNPDGTIKICTDGRYGLPSKSIESKAYSQEGEPQSFDDVEKGETIRVLGEAVTYTRAFLMLGTQETCLTYETLQQK